MHAFEWGKTQNSGLCIYGGRDTKQSPSSSTITGNDRESFISSQDLRYASET